MSTSDAPADQTPGDAPLAVTPSVTGAPSIDAALGRLDGLDGAPLGDHAAVYEQVHDDLRNVLDDPGDSAAGSHLRPDAGEG